MKGLFNLAKSLPSVVWQRMVSERLILTLFVGCLLLLNATASGSKLVIKTSLGGINGVLCGDSDSMVASFRGIPYAQPPVGELRWAAPVKYHIKYPKAGLDASIPGPSCRQGIEGTEDCLYLNVWAPANVSARSKLPVRVFIHGGGFQTGAGTEPIYDGCKVVQDGNVVFVTMNYRLGILGFLALPELRDSTANFRVGNWGLLDQRLALQWVKDNIAAFGGDPKKVVLSGESAGAYSTLLHLVAPGSRGLFSSAASFSGSADAMAVDFLRDAYNKGRKIRTALNCTAENSTKRGYTKTRDCLRDVDADVIMKVQRDICVETIDYCIPTIDGVEIQKHPVKLMEEGRASSKVPVLLGVNANEGALEVIAQTGALANIDLKRFFEVVTNLIPIPVTYYERVYEQYDAVEYYGGNWIVAAMKAVTDGGYHCPSRRAAVNLAKQGVPVRYHILEASQPNSGCPLLIATGLDHLGQEITDLLGALHTYDIPLTFLAPYRSPYNQCPFTAAETQLASFLSGIINSMADIGAPLPPRSSSLTSTVLINTPSWPVWNTTSSLVMDIDTAGPKLYAASDLWFDLKCQLWDDMLADYIVAGTTAFS